MPVNIGRRELIAALGGVPAWPLAARAQHAPGKVARVGIIDDSPSWDPFRQQLRELNYVEGQNIAYVYLRTDGSPAQLEAAAAALVQVHVRHGIRRLLQQRPDHDSDRVHGTASATARVFCCTCS